MKGKAYDTTGRKHGLHAIKPRLLYIFIVSRILMRMRSERETPKWSAGVTDGK